MLWYLVIYISIRCDTAPRAHEALLHMVGVPHSGWGAIINHKIIKSWHTHLYPSFECFFSFLTLICLLSFTWKGQMQVQKELAFLFFIPLTPTRFSLLWTRGNTIFAILALDRHFNFLRFFLIIVVLLEIIEWITILLLKL